MWNSTVRMADCKVHQNTQMHNIISHGAVTPQTFSHFTVPPIGWTVMTVDKCKKMGEMTTIHKRHQGLAA
jgi:hypothetical protein